MNEPDLKDLRERLRRAMPPVADGDLRRDLWPRMRQRMNQPPRRVPWWDWALGAALAAWCFYFPDALLGLFYHL